MLPGRITTLSGTCGVLVAHYFGITNTYANQSELPVLSNLKLSAGWVIAGFIHNQYCKKAYEQWSEKYNIVYQSPVRKNRNSGNQFFFVIFDTQTVKESK